jgi:RES domain
LHPDDREALAAKRICCNCVREDFLRAEIASDGAVALCEYCGDDEDKTWSMGDVADSVEQAFENHYVRTATEADPSDYYLYADRDFGRTWYRDGQETAEAIQEAAGIPEDAAADVQTLLGDRYDDVESGRMGEETEFAPDAHYDFKGTDAADWHREWMSFENALKTEARFFSRSGAEHLAATFNGIDALATTDGSPLVVEAGPQRPLDHLYRARVFQSEAKLTEALCRPDLHLGSPPVALASAGRMNARGISVFYGATGASTAIAEVRPPVGSKVAVARFAITRPLRLLDLTVLDKVNDDGSIFDPTLKRRLERVSFLRTLGQRITRPVMPDDEAFDYLATQAIADFLATENEPRLDGIIFSSAQSKDGRNVVLFHKAARVAELDLPPGTVVEADTHYDTDEGPETDYRVSEVVPPATPPAPDEHFHPMLFRFNPPDPFDGDFRDNTLQVEPGSVEVHHVNWVAFDCTAHGVTRHRREKREPKF